MSYQGPVRILDGNGVLLTVGIASLDIDPELDTWSGRLSVLDGTGVAGKALVVEFEVNGRRSLAQLVPEGVQGENALAGVVGLGQPPFDND